MARELRAYKIKRQIQELNNALSKHQRCKHTKVIKVAGSNTGNWCPSDDFYWYNCNCPTCLKRWTEPQ